MGNLGWALLAGLAGGALLSSFMGPGKAPEPAPLLAPTADAVQPQGATQPSYQQAFNKNKKRESAGPMSGPASTFLTGPSGIDSSQLNLGRNALLGG